jgi:hypothetical protein
MLPEVFCNGAQELTTANCELATLAALVVAVAKGMEFEGIGRHLLHHETTSTATMAVKPIKRKEDCRITVSIATTPCSVPTVIRYNPKQMSLTAPRNDGSIAIS